MNAGRDRVILQQRWFVVEFQRIGAYARVTVTDEITGLKASAIGPVHGQDETLRQTAARKLMNKLGLTARF